MTTHVCILGIDGSGKSTVVSALPELISGVAGVRAGKAGESFSVVDPDQTLLAPNFAPSGRPILSRIALLFKRAAKRYVDRLWLYPVFKVLQLVFQDAATRSIERRYQPDIIVSDGNTILSVAGRAVNYLRPARSEGRETWDVEVDRLSDTFMQLAGLQKAEGWIRVVSRAARLLKSFGFHTLWLPDVVILLDLSPERALDRIQARGVRIDAHENRVDLGRARRMYLRTVDAMTACFGKAATVRIPAGDQAVSAVIDRALQPLRARIENGTFADIDGRLGRTQKPGAVWRQFLSPGYLIHCLGAQFFKGTWREPLFPVSKLGRHFMEEGYSASVMQDIYDQDHQAPSLLDRPFTGYPLHRAVYDRLHLLVPRITSELILRDGPIRIFTGPSGLSEDVFRSLEAAARWRPGGIEDIEVTALDLDPDGRIGKRLRARSHEMGLTMNFIQGDLASTRWSEDDGRPFDIAIFVGLSSWLPRPQLLSHLRRLKESLSEDGVLFTDVFTAGAYALSGWHAGYQANYYEPKTFASLLDVCGFNGGSAVVTSGRDRLNHVMVCKPTVIKVDEGEIDSVSDFSTEAELGSVPTVSSGWQEEVEIGEGELVTQ
jgi:thymidylate kinase